MTQIYANNFTTLVLGRRGENLARKVVFDIRDLESLYGTGDVEVIYQRPGDAQPYPMAVQRDGTLVTWDVTETDTEMSDGSGKCELRYYVGEVLAKSKTWQTWVEPAMDTPSETAPPEPEQGWVDKVIEAGAEAKQAAQDAADALAGIQPAKEQALEEIKAEGAAQISAATAQANRASEAAGQAAESAETSRAAADRAENAAIHQPYPDASTGTWWCWDIESGAYVDSGITAKADELHIASPDVLGGVQPVAQTDTMMIPVGVDATGKLYAGKDPDVNQLKYDLADLAENEIVILDYTLAEDAGDSLSIQLDSNVLDGVKTILFWFNERHDSTEDTGWNSWKLTNRKTNNFNEYLLLSYGHNPKCIDGILRCYGFSVFFNDYAFSAFRKGVQNTPKNDGATSLNALYGDFPLYLGGTLALEYNGNLKAGTRIILVGRY